MQPCRVVPQTDYSEETLASWLARWILGLEIPILVITTRLADFRFKLKTLLDNHV